MATVRAMVAVTVGDERRHDRGRERLWCEAWYFDFAAPDLSAGGFVRLGLYPNLGVAWYWAALVGPGRRLVLVRDHEIELSRRAPLEVRAQGLWSSVNCETPLDHWSIGLEAFAVALDDPLEAYRGERGDLVGLGFDLEWEARASAFTIGAGHYGQSCQVHGEILVGDEQLAFEGAGQRAHTWGVADWWSAPRAWAGGVLSDGTSFTVTTGSGTTGLGTTGSGAGPGVGFLTAKGEPAQAGKVELAVETDVAGLLAPAALAIDDLALESEPLAHAPLLLEAPDGGRSRLARALCRYRAADGREGGGWMELSRRALKN